MNVDASYDNHWGKTETWIHLLEGMANPRMAQQPIPGRSGRTEPRLQQQVLEEEGRRNTAVRAELASFPVQDGRTANLWQELSVAIFGHNSQKCGSVRCRSGKSKGVASSLWLQSQPRYSSRLLIRRPCYNTSQLNASTRNLREIELYLTFALDGDRKSCSRPVRLDPYYVTLAHDLNGNHRTSVQRHNEIHGAMWRNGRSSLY